MKIPSCKLSSVETSGLKCHQRVQRAGISRIVWCKKNRLCGASWLALLLASSSSAEFTMRDCAIGSYVADVGYVEGEIGFMKASDDFLFSIVWSGLGTRRTEIPTPAVVHLSFGGPRDILSHLGGQCNVATCLPFVTRYNRVLHWHSSCENRYLSVSIVSHHCIVFIN